MTAATSTEIEIQRFRNAGRQYAFVATFMFAGISTLVVGILAVILLRGQALGGTRVLRLAISWTPAIGYLWALWTLRGMFRTLARDGLTFQPAITLALARLGAALGIGAALSMMEGGVMYFLTRAWRTGGAVPTGPDAIMSVNVPAMTLWVTSVALTLLAQMLARGARLEAETTRLKAALNDFI